MRRFVLVAFLAVWSPSVWAVSFTTHELFRIPFGTTPETLGSQVKDGQFLFPRDFTIDNDGHFYIYDSPRHRIVRYSFEGRYEMQLRYPETAQQVFAHPDSQKNLWILVGDPNRGIFYGVYDERGKEIHSGTFAQFNKFKLHVDDDYALHVILSSPKRPEDVQTYLFDEKTLRMTKESVAQPPETHHEIQTGKHKYFIDQIPDASDQDAAHENKITDESHRAINEINGTVIYIDDRGEIFTRVGPRLIHVYNTDGALIGTVHLVGLDSAVQAIRFDADGNMYELDGIPDHDNQYTPTMQGLRVLKWQRES